MKKVFIVIVMLLASSLFAVDKLKVGDTAGTWQTPYNYYNGGSFSEICPVNETVCKVVIENRIVEYLRIGDVLILTGRGPRREEKYVIKSFDYNVIEIERITPQ